ncbi:ABC transporter ATP-binding protein [Lujinxingia litoralis]|uniref:ABC transporter ATP-binding protein n=1 Tax=Lujinxingia litoralis TaxID=2211119 RepID=A0A328C563_9DELT|nr:ATP-binding cassette domain-containing protein [Lujinxingia litoralis]RAL21126.1 ABC transporter ATP-binding protein [Lujinxingia litoralis]
MRASQVAARLERVSFSYPQAMVELFSELDLHLSPGWHGLVGANGAGKSTLLHLLAARLTPTHGQIHIALPGPVVLCEQRVNEPGPLVEEAAHRWDKEAMRLKSRLGLEFEGWARWETLSPGERKRWQIGAALMARPAMLLLDEPTNHLDAPGQAWLLEAMRLHKGLGVVVSHRRELLDALCTSTLWVESRAERASQIQVYPVPYSQAAELRQAASDHARQTRQTLQARCDRQEQAAREAARRQQSAERSLKSSSRMSSARDSDARSMGNKIRASWAEAGAGRQAGIATRALQKMRAELAELPIEKTRWRALHIDFEPSPKDPVLSLPGVDLVAGTHRLARDLRLALGRHEKIALRGPNGAGKSTLLRLALDHLHIPRDRVLYLPQELSLEQSTALIDELRALPGPRLGEVMNIVAALGMEPRPFLKGDAPSPGQMRKLALARALHQRVWAMVLDEPTNHLDLPSIELLEEALLDYPGALLLVSHDQNLCQRVAPTHWHLEGQTLQVKGPDSHEAF